jgi:hypothetical protein
MENKEEVMVNATDSKREAFIREIELELQYVANHELTEEEEDDSYQTLMDQLDMIYRKEGLIEDLSLWEFRKSLDMIDDLELTYAEGMIAAINFLTAGTIPGAEEEEPVFIDASEY